MEGTDHIPIRTVPAGEAVYTTKPVAPAAGGTYTTEQHAEPRRQIRIRPVREIFSREGSYLWPALGAIASLFILGTIASWGLPAAVSGVCRMAGYDGEQHMYGEDMVHRGMEKARSAYEQLPGMSDIQQQARRAGMDMDRMMAQQKRGGGWFSGSLWPWNWMRSSTSTTSRMTGSSAYNERVSEEAVWKAIERVADELKHDAHKRYHGGVYEGVRDAAHHVYDAAALPVRVVRGAYQGARAEM